MRQQRIQMKLAEFRERQEEISRSTGMHPLGFFAFEKSSPTPRRAQPENKWLGALLGGGLGALLGVRNNVVEGLAIGGGIGFLFGALFNKESEISRTEHAVKRYGDYLDVFDVAAAQGHQITSVQPYPLTGHSHAQALLDARAQPAADGLLQK